MKSSISVFIFYLFLIVINAKYTKNPIMIGYYQTWGEPFIKLRDVNPNWDVINIAFAIPKIAGSTNGRMILSFDEFPNYSFADFKSDIKYLQNNGKKVVLSIGGATGYFSLETTTSIQTFVDSISEMIDEYGFDGIDIDLEQYSVEFVQGQDQDINVINSPKILNFVTAIKDLCLKYGDDFILSWAPETFYVHQGYTYYAGINEYCDSRAGVYLPMINALRKETTFVHVQYYNSGSMPCTDGKEYAMGSKETLVALNKMLLKGFYVGGGLNVEKTQKTWFAPLNPEQVAIGLPASRNAAGSGFTTNKDIQDAFKELVEEFPGFRGIMAWSINIDLRDNQDSFVEENAKFISQFKNEENNEQKNEKEKYTKIGIMIGYYQTWDSKSSPFIKLRDVNEKWDVINIAFTEPESPGSTNGKMVFYIHDSDDYQKEDFISDIKNLQKQGKKILLSIGGGSSPFSLLSEKAVNQFVNDIITIIDEYGFDGIDIDAEGNSIEFEVGKDQDINEINSPKILYMLKAINAILDHYGDDFMLTWAPETVNVQQGYDLYGGINSEANGEDGSYLPLINALRDRTTYVHVQYYNSGSMLATDGKAYEMGTKEGIVAMTKMMLEGFYINEDGTKKSSKTWFAPLDPSQVAIGLPASTKAAGSGYTQISDVQEAYDELEKNYHGLRGIMAWSINCDSYDNENAFVEKNAKFLEKYRK